MSRPLSPLALRVVHPSGHKRVNAVNPRFTRWLLGQESSSLSQCRENSVSVLCRDFLHLATKGFKQRQYIFGVDGRWQLVGRVWGGVHSSSVVGSQS